MLRAHLSVIPKLAMGILECNGLMEQKELDEFMNTILRSVCRVQNYSNWSVQSGAAKNRD